MLTVTKTAATPVTWVPDLAQRIGEWSADFQPSPMRLARIKASVRDFVGCVAAGTLRGELRSALWLAHGGGVPVWGLADSFDPAGAALVTGTAGALLQLHDVYAPGSSHPSAPVIAAAWSALQDTGGASVDGFLCAVAAGYEVANRISQACVPSQLLAGSSPTGTAGSIGAAVAAAKLRNLDAVGIGRAVTNAALLLPATPFAAMRSHGALVPLHPGLAARAGYEAASLARDADAGRYILEGDLAGAGLIGLLGGDATAIEPERWNGETIDAIGWKFFPACLATHAALEAVLRLDRVDPASIERVVVRRPSGPLDSMVANGPHDGCLYDRLMSVRWVLARALELGRYEYPDAIDDSRSTFELAHKIELLDGQPTHPAVAPDSWTRVEVYAGGGLESSIDYVRLPDPVDPQSGPRGWTTTLNEMALRKKFAALIDRAPVVGQHLKLLGID